MADIEAPTIVLTGAGVIVAIVYGILTLRDTTRTRQAELYMRIYERGSTVEFYSAAELVVEGSHWRDFSQFLGMYQKDPAFHAAIQRLGGFYEGLGVLVRENLLDIRLVALFFTSTTKQFWEKLRDSVYEWRKVSNTPRMLSETEYLYNELMKCLDRHPEVKT